MTLELYLLVNCLYLYCSGFIRLPTDVVIKSRQKCCPKSGYSSVYLICHIFQIRSKSFQFSDYFCKKIWVQDLSKIVQSGYTGRSSLKACLDLSNLQGFMQCYREFSNWTRFTRAKRVNPTAFSCSIWTGHYPVMPTSEGDQVSFFI